MSTAYIALGSNLDDPARQLQQAVTAIGALQDSSITALSSVYRSAAVGPGEQPDYLNAVLALATGITPAQLLDKLLELEDRQGRVRTVRWGARTLDLDILLYDDRQVSTETLTIPHPAMKQRNFVLYPLAEIAGKKLLLPCGSDLGTLLQCCPGGDLVPIGVTLHKPLSENQGVRP
jgi:2-amino-4-hydroxy-6-hydroxymethyldihydropteridine diphosphokinase